MFQRPRIKTTVLLLLFIIGLLLPSFIGGVNAGSLPVSGALAWEGAVSEGAVSEGAVSEGAVDSASASGTGLQTAPVSCGDGQLRIVYLDVGQGDSTLILLPNGQTLLIDAGNPHNAADIIAAVRAAGRDTLDYVIATHPHADHIGGMAEVLRAFEVGTLWMPRVVHTSRTFERLLDVAQEQGIETRRAIAGRVLFDFGQLHAEFLAPCSEEYSNLNDYSAVLRLTYKDRHFLFMGDAEHKSEAQILSGGAELCADVIKIGHHGSKTSSAKAFIAAVRPSVAVVSVGAGNSYGHPAAQTLSVLRELNVDIWRTDERGTVLIESDGEELIVRSVSAAQPNAPPESLHAGSCPAVCAPAGTENEETTVYITDTGKKYHRAGCRYLCRSTNPVKLEELDTDKYTPCTVCRPPTK